MLEVIAKQNYTENNVNIVHNVKSLSTRKSFIKDLLFYSLHQNTHWSIEKSVRAEKENYFFNNNKKVIT